MNQVNTYESVQNPKRLTYHLMGTQSLGPVDHSFFAPVYQTARLPKVFYFGSLFVFLRENIYTLIFNGRIA